MRKKRGQISFYIVIGIIILIGVALVIYIEGQQKKKPLIINNKVVPKEILPVREFVQDCIENIAEEAIVRLGQQGGYLYLPSYIANDRQSYVEVDSLGIIKVPYWDFQGRSRMPMLLDMEEDISRYIKENLPGCVSNFTIFENEFLVRQTDMISILVSITERNVVINAIYPLSITVAGTDHTTEVQNFNTRSPVLLKKAHEYASEIMKKESLDFFLENITLDLMAMNPGIPFTGLEFDCGKVFWRTSDIKDKLASALYLTLPRIRFEDTEYMPFIAKQKVYDDLSAYTIEDIFNGKTPTNRPDDAYEYFHLLIDASDKDFKELRAGIYYDKGWGMSLSANPSDNGILSPTYGSGHSQFLKYLCFKLYHFTYDLTYPTMVVIADDESFNGKGYVMRFAIPVQIIHNKPERRDVGITIFKSYETNSGFCNNDGQEIDIRAKGYSDGYQGVELDEVNISYDCFKYECVLGQTQADAGIFRLRTNLPSGCNNGFLIAEKAGYLKTRVQQNGPYQEIDLKSVKMFNLTFVKHPKNDLSNAKALDPWDSVVMHIESVDGEYETYVDYTPGTESEIELILEDTKYKVDIMMYDNLDNTIYGGYKGNLSIARYDLLNADTIVLHVVESLPKPFTMEDNVAIAKYLIDDWKIYSGPLKPTFES